MSLVVNAPGRGRSRGAALGPTLPSWAASLAIGQVAQVPTSNSLASLNPNGNASLNPTHPTNYWTDHASIINAWCGATYDQGGDRLWLPLSGGHQDYAGNEPYYIDVWANNPTWVMARPPSGSLPLGTLTLNDGQEGTGVHSDGRPRASHSYGNLCYAPGIGPIVTMQGALYRNGGALRKAWFLNETTGEHSLAVDWTSATASGAAYGFGVWDSLRQRVFSCGSEFARPYTLDLATGIATPRGSQGNIASAYIMGAYCSGLDAVVGLSGPAAGYRAVDGLTIFDPATGDDHHPGFTGSFAAGFNLGGQAGMAWDEANNRLLLWHNSSNTAQISTLTPPAGNKLTQPWVAGSLPVFGGNAVTPSSCNSNGTYGRFAYSPKMGGCFILNSTSNGNLYFVRTT